MNQRHSWGLPHRFEHKTERQCLNCRIVKVTRHEAICWTEYWRDLDRIECDRAPACEVVSVGLEKGRAA
jgi:hypothetical protein